MKDTYFVSKSTFQKSFLHNFLLNKISLFVLILTLAGLLDGFGQVDVDFTTPGTTTWTVPAGITSITIQCVGGGGTGGSGRGGMGGSDQGAGGGAGGQYASSTITVSPGDVLDIRVAAVINGPITNNSNGFQGDFSSVSFGATTYARANGGNGGVAANGSRLGGIGNTTGGIGNIIVRSGGNGGDGTTTASGAGGGGGGSTGNGGNGSGTTGGTGAANFGGNGGAGRTTNGAGNAGFLYGGGGSGGRRNNTGGNGAQGFVRISHATPPPPANNLCSGAIPLSVSGTCTYTNYTNASATDSGVANPGCANYLGGDVWFSVVVPANGIITVDTQTGVITDSGVAIYSGTCGALTLIECDDDDSANGFMSSITRVGLTPGSTIFIRIWEYDNNNNGTFGICVTSPPSPTITSLGAVSGCVGSSLVITGTNLTGATAVTIGGTAATITGNTATTVTVTVGTGTTGTVQVTTPGGSATSAATFTVNPLPAAIGGGSATVCTGATTPAFTNASPGGTWSTSNANATINASGVLTGVTAGAVNVIYTLPTGCSITRAVTVITTPTTVITPTPSNNATGVCYAGSGAVTNISWGAVAGATSYDVYFGTGSVPAIVTANVATNTYITGALTANTTYYWRVVAKNACGDAPSSANFSFTTSSAPCYCAPTYTFGPGTTDGITNVTLLTLNNNSGANNVSPYYTFYNSVTIPDLFQSSTPTISISYGTDANQWSAVWIDFNQNGVFETTEGFISSVNAGASGTSVISITVPAGAILGNTRMRVRGGNDSALTTAQACGASSSGYGETEDYIVNIIAPVACTTPTAQPTALALTPASGAISGSFTAATPTANSYLVVISTSATPPTAPVNGTTYTIGSSVASGYTVVDNDSNTIFTASGLAPLTTYYFYIYSFNNFCTGGPLYLGTSPFTGNATSLAPVYCVPTINAAYQTNVNHHINEVAFIGTLQDIVNTSTYTAAAPFGYENYTGLATKPRQAKGEGVNIYVESPFSGYIKAWVDWNSDGDFGDAGETVYDAGGVSQASTTLGFIIPTSILAGDYRVRIRVSGYNGLGFDAGFGWNACSTNLAYYGETEDYLLEVIDNCANKILTVTDGSVCGSGIVNLQATSSGSPTGFRWYSSETSGALLADTAIGTWNTPSISSTTDYWVTSYDGICETLVRTKITAFVKPVPTISFATSNTEVCGEESVVALTATGGDEVVYLIDEKFETGMGSFTNVHYVNNAAVDATTAWQIETGPFVPTGTTWFPAISSNFGANSFAFVNSDVGTCGPSCYYTVDNGLVSSTINSTGFLSLTLNFRLYFDRYYQSGAFLPDELMTIDVSIDGGSNWLPISGNLVDDIGYGTRFNDYSYNLDAYINESNLKVRVRYYTSTWANGAAVDDIELFGTKPLSTALEWTGTPLPDVYTDAATLVPYVLGSPATTVYVKPQLSQLETGSYTFTATATLTNGCNVSQDITVLNKSTIWKGTVDNDWNNPNNWMPAVIPDINSCVIIPNVVNSSTITGTNYDAFGKTLIIKNGGELNIESNNTLTISNTVTVDATGIFTIQNSGSLIQIDNVANSGTINVLRNAITDSSLDYVYWSTPVAGFSVNNITPSSTYRYAWNPTTVTGYASNFGNWIAASGAMTTGLGYIVRGSSGTSTFTGVPNNGDISAPITRSTYTGVPYAGPTATPVTEDDDNWNLLGNPYPSAISADDFLLANNSNLEQFVKIWTHGIDPAAIADPFYQDYQLNYNTNDYITYNALGGTQFGFDGKIGAGQGFFVLMNDANTTSENVQFNNTMRSNTHRNDQFYRTTSNSERHRIWLKLIHPNTSSCDALVGYTTNATNSIDVIYDTKNVGVKTTFEVYSIAESKGLVIQGRMLPFDVNDQIPLGVTIPQNGIYTLAINAVDGLFEDASQNIYLEDLVLGITHDLRASPYTFTGTTGVHENRFVLKFTNETLGNEDFTTNFITVYTNESINVNAPNQNIKSVRIHDLLGRMLGTFNNINSDTFTSKSIIKTNSPLLIEVTLDNGAKKNYKVIF